MNTQLTAVVATCNCCTQPKALLPRDDLGAGLAVCGTTGQLYRPEGDGYIRTTMPNLATNREVSAVRIDLSRTGYS